MESFKELSLFGNLIKKGQKSFIYFKTKYENQEQNNTAILYYVFAKFSSVTHFKTLTLTNLTSLVKVVIFL